MKISTAVSRHFFFGWMAAALQLQILRAHSLPWSNLASNRRGMSARARQAGMVVLILEPVTADIGEQEEHFFGRSHLSLPPISPRTGEINGRQARSLIVAGRRSTYRPLLASVFNVPPAWVHLDNHNSSASPHRSGSWKKCKCCIA